MKNSINVNFKFPLVGLCILLNIACTNNEVSEAEAIAQPLTVAPSEINSNDNLPLKPVSPLAILNDLIGLNCESDKECKVAGIGHSPCGGHVRYVVYSETDSEVKMLRSKIDSYNELQKQKNIKEKKLGICQHIPAPATACSENRCIAVRVGANQQNSEL